MRSNLVVNTEILYRTFSDYSIPEDLRKRSCECCVNDDEIQILLSKPLNKLSVNEIGHFMRSAISTFGGINDYKHFLPRILELIQNEKNEVTEDFLDYEKLNYGKWKTWKIDEIKAISNYFLSLWEKTIINEKISISEIGNILTIVIRYLDVNDLLIIWEQSNSLKSTEFIVDFVLNEIGLNLAINKKVYYTILEWLSTEVVLQKIENTFFTVKDKKLANRISITYTILSEKS